MARPADPNARNALVTAARAEFVRRGLKGARIEDITAVCGLSKGAFYLHFRSKEELFRELVEGFTAQLLSHNEERMEEARAFVARHGPLSARDVSGRTVRHRARLEMDAANDLKALELMWAHRDLFAVLVSGSQGTEFEDTVWLMLEHEFQRVEASVVEMQRLGACRTDIPGQMFASMLVGTFFLLAKWMIRAESRPDLESWSRDIHRLLSEGTAPRPAAPARAARTPPSASAPLRKRPATGARQSPATPSPKSSPRSPTKTDRSRS